MELVSGLDREMRELYATQHTMRGTQALQHRCVQWGEGFCREVLGMDKSVRRIICSASKNGMHDNPPEIRKRNNEMGSV